MRERAIKALLWLYERAVKLGLLEHPLTRRAFEAVYLLYKRLLEAGPVSRLRDLVPAGTTAIDVGANIGFFALRFGRWVGPGGRVIAIEPESRNADSLRRRVARAHLEEVVECVEAAASDRPGEVRLALNPLHPGDHRIAESGEPVRAVTVDELAAGSDRKVSLLKIDVQGAEAMVLAGARLVLEEQRPAVFVELDDDALRSLGSSAEELIASVVGLGYTAHALTRNGIGPPEPVERLVAKSAAGSYSDVLFLPEA
jgi:FkbM family methyltransferase